jgi:hypothetical protein
MNFLLKTLSSSRLSWLADFGICALSGFPNSHCDSTCFTIRPPRTVYKNFPIESINAERLLYVFFRKKFSFTAKDFLQGKKKASGGRFPVFNGQSAVGSLQKNEVRKMRREELKKRKEPVWGEFSWFNHVCFHVGTLNNRCLPLIFSKKGILQTKKIQLPARVHKTPAGTGFLFNYKQKTEKKLPVAGGRWSVSGMQSAIENKEDRYKKEVRHKKKQKTQKNLKKDCKGLIYFEDTVPRIDFSHLAPLTPNKGKSVRFTVFLQTKPEFVGKKNRSPLFPVSRQHVPERPSGSIMDFDLHDNFSLSKERVIPKTSNGTGLNMYLYRLKQSERFRHPAVISFSTAAVTDIPAGSGSFGQEGKEGS